MEYISNDKKIRVVDKLNSLMSLHKNETQSELMIKQYQNMRQQFLEELKTILFDFQLNVEVLKAV
jgi:uncharacterized protein YnzC (UPF0291/DUF896 family)